MGGLILNMMKNMNIHMIKNKAIDLSLKMVCQHFGFLKLINHILKLQKQSQEVRLNIF
jgi:hypothetical protein